MLLTEPPLTLDGARSFNMANILNAGVNGIVFTASSSAALNIQVGGTNAIQIGTGATTNITTLALNGVTGALVPGINVTSSTAITAVAGNHYILRGGSTTVTLPSTPAAGNIVWVTVANSLTVNKVARNGVNIQGLAEDIILDSPFAAVQFRYSDATMGWVFC